MLLNDDAKLSKVLDVLIKIYKNLEISNSGISNSYAAMVNGRVVNNLFSYVYFTDKFWTKFIMFNDTYDPRIETLAYLSKVNCSILLHNKHNDCINNFYNNKNIIVEIIF